MQRIEKQWLFGALGFLLRNESRVVVIANGSDLPAALPTLIDGDWPIVCADGGANRLLALGAASLRPRLIVGDLDSVTAATLAAYGPTVELLRRPSQELNDMEKALDESLQRWPAAQPLIFGGLGGSLQHALANFSSMQGRAQHSPVCYSPDNQVVCLQANAVHRLSNCPVGRSFGLFPLAGRCDWARSEGLAWNLHDGTQLEFGRFVSSSNRFASDEATIEAATPLFLVVDGSSSVGQQK